MFSKIILLLVLLLMNYPASKQDCSSEVNIKGIPVTWPASPEGVNLTSSPICFDGSDQVITRNCSETNWIPSRENTSLCVKIINEFLIDACPPGYAPIPYNNSIYCFEITPVNIWEYPCYQSGGASVLSDLHTGEIEGLLDILNSSYYSQYYWLPAQRVKRFNPLVWTTPGPNWGTLVSEIHNIPFHSILFKNCLKLDVKNRIITTEYCNIAYPSLCLYIKDINYPADCPDGYRAIRYMNEFNTCFGVERSTSPNGSTFNDFLENQCDKPMGDNEDLVLTSFIFQKMATYLDLSEDLWCWFAKVSKNNSRLAYLESVNTSTALTPSTPYEGVINRQGSLGLLDKSKRLSCMACEKDMRFSNTEFLLSYQQSEQRLHLTICTPWGLWKYSNDDKGFRCFSNAKGFITPVSASRLALVTDVDEEDEYMDKLEYIINPISDRIGEYWCEGHTKEFILITSNVVMVSLESINEHVFALCVELKLKDTEYNFPDLTEYKTTIKKIYDAENVILMDILEVTEDERAIVVIHVHVALSTESDMFASNIGETLISMKNTAIEELCEHNITFVNISSSMYCLPTVSEDIFQLEWSLTAIGQIAAPIQFCLQNNGLPVKRKCLGSYITGAMWGPVEGSCKKNYQPSNTTTFLYEFAMRMTPEHYTTRFLTDGLSYVLNDVDIIIPADIYYLSMSLKHISQVAQENSSCLELGDLENIAWTMDRLMVLNNHYLNLAQTLNSTNVILDSVTNIIEVLATTNITNIKRKRNIFYQYAVQPQFVTQYSYPMHNNISGIALLRPKNTSTLFNNMTIIPLYVNTSLDDILSQEYLEIATWVPENVLRTLEPLDTKTEDHKNTTFNYEDIYIVINIFYNDAIFQEVDKRNHVINSNIIEIEIPGFSTSLKHAIPLVFKVLDKKRDQTRSFCGYWDFHDSENATVPGYWNKNGCYFKTKINGTVVCKCMHLTHFAQLISPSTSNTRPPKENYKHSRALNIITLVGSFLSLGGILGIWITATVFSIWRRKAGTKVLLQLSLAIAMPLIIIIIFSFSRSIFVIKDGLIEVSDSRKVLCIVLGALLHYSILVGFVWMLITAVLQFVRYVRVIGVTRPARFMIKLTLIGWGLPTLPVALVLLINKDNYLPTPSNSTAPSICYPTGIYFFLSVLFPIVVIVIINISLFISVLVSISKGPGGKMRTVDLDLVKAQMRLSVFLFFLLGLTWVFGIFSFSDSLVWSYLFCLTSTMQGFVLFVYFVVCDPSTRNLWITLVKPQFRTFSSRESITSLSH